MTILRDLTLPLQNVFSESNLGQRRARWFCYTLIAIMVPFTRSITSNLLRSLNGLFGFNIEQSRYYTFMGSNQLPWDELWAVVWSQIRQPKTRGQLVLALDDFVNPKCGKKIFGCGRFFDHAAKSNQTRFPWSQCVVSLGLLIKVKARWACLPLGSRFYIKHKDIQVKTINACSRGIPVTFETKMKQANTLIERVVDHFQSDALIVCDSWFGNNGLWRLLRDQSHDQSIHLLSRLRSNNQLYDMPEAINRLSKRGRPPKYGSSLGSVDELAKRYQIHAEPIALYLYGKRRDQLVYSRIVMSKSMRCAIRVVWIYYRTRYVALYTTDLSLDVTQIIEYYAARWKIEASFKEIKQDIGSAASQTRDAYAVSNHLQMCLMATTITWQYAQRMNRAPNRRHEVINRISFAFSDVRRAVAKEAFSDHFSLDMLQNRQSANKSIFKTIMQLVA